METTENTLSIEEMWKRIQESDARIKARQSQLDGDMKKACEKALEAMQAAQRITAYRWRTMAVAFFFGFLTGLAALTMTR